jgi:deazaflavin-dependent oxidoreductase (nitroreductase family)
MPIPMAVARFNRRATNRLTGRFAGRMTGFAIVTHRGRTSGREYRTPINVFRRTGGYAMALTYGPESQWVRNVLAAGGCEIETRGRHVKLTNPRIVHDPRRRLVPPPIRVILGLMGVNDFLLLDEQTSC